MVSKYIMDLNELGDYRGHMISSMMSLRNTINIHLLKILFFKDNGLFYRYFDDWAGEITSKIIELGELLHRKTLKHIDHKDFIRIVFKGFHDDPTLIEVFIKGIMKKTILLSPFILKKGVGGKDNEVDEEGIKTYIQNHRNNIENFLKEVGGKIEAGYFDLIRKYPADKERKSARENEITPEVKKLIQTHIIGISE